MATEKQNTPNWLGINAPRYTSYPTAPNFNQEVTEDLYKTWLSSISNESISLYIHIPFCKKLCWFCGCATAIVDHYSPIKTYFELLLKEISIIAKQINKKGSITHIHFGGGSPTILSEEDFSKLMDAIYEQFNISLDPEISIEIDPRNVDEKKIKLYAQKGVNRASIGVQDFNEKTQIAINRIQPFEMVEELFSQLRKNNINSINIDLIYGLPYQTIESIKNTAKRSLELEPKRIALFSYAHVPWMKKHHNLIDLEAIVNNEERLKMFIDASEIFENNNYQAIGIDHFAKKEDNLSQALKQQNLKRNFQGYTSDSADILIGLGLSSIGQLKQGYIQNSPKNKEYKSLIEQGKLPIIRGKIISQEDKIRKEIIDSIMSFMEVDLEKIIQKHQLSDNYFDKELTLIDELYEDVTNVIGKTIKITTKYKMAARAVAATFDQYFTIQKDNYSKVV